MTPPRISHAHPPWMAPPPPSPPTINALKKTKLKGPSPSTRGADTTFQSGTASALQELQRANADKRLERNETKHYERGRCHTRKTEHLIAARVTHYTFRSGISRKQYHNNKKNKKTRKRMGRYYVRAQDCWLKARHTTPTV